MDVAGVVSKIRLENFMCHSKLEIVLGDWVNFITGQNGSGKSAILTALCVAFGCRAKGTQRASTLKDFIKNGCSSAIVSVEIKNKGEDAFKPEIYGDMLIIERRITEATSSTILKDCYGKKISQRKNDLREIVDHFNIDVENPCVIMSQDKSREFLHSGNNKDKFKFFFKATLLQQVNDLLQSIAVQLESANAVIDELELSIRPIQKEINELLEKITNMERLEQISLEAKDLKKKLAWSWVYSTDNDILHQETKIGKLSDRIPACQERIDKNLVRLEGLEAEFISKKNQIDLLVGKTSEMKRKKDELEESISVVKRKQYELQEKVISKTRILEKLSICLKDLHQQIHDVQEQYNKSTQDVESIHKDDLKRAQIDIDSAQSLVSRLTDEETTLFQQLSTKKNTTMEINKEIEEFKKNVHEKSNQIRMHQQCQNNKVTAFGGDRVLSLLQAIEKHHREFRRPPIGPIGVHVKLIDGDFWALAIENAIGRMLDAFIVTDSKDAGVLRKCANEANYRNVQILIYNFSTRLSIPTNMLPSTRHPTIYSVLNCDSPVVQNILVDMKHIERTVLVDNYDSGKEIVFKQHIQNLSDVFTSNGTQLFFRNSVETTLPPNRRCKTGRLCGSVEEHISKCENDIMRLNELIDQGIKRKRSNEDDYLKINARAQDVKRQRFHEQSLLMSKQNDLKSMKDSYAVESSANPAPPVEEVLHRQILDIQNKMDLEKASMDNIKHSLVSTELKDKELMLSFEKLCDLAKGDIDAIDEAEKEFSGIEQNISQAQEEKTHYERFMNDKVLPTLREAKDQYESLKRKRQEDIEKASIICPESDVITLGGCAGKTPEQLSAQLSRIKKRLHLESVGCPESIDDLRILHGKKQRKIAKKQQIYNGFHEKLNSCQKALDFRWTKFKRNASLLKRELTWQFNGHLSKKGISGQINVNYDEKTLSVEVKMPQDTSHKTVRDTRGLSGGERSFSTLCFSLALHGMTESPFRAMDEFDVFMDAVSRKISMDTLVDFALLEGSQWILITPHDTSTVKSGSKIKKQQMEAPRA